MKNKYLLYMNQVIYHLRLSELRKKGYVAFLSKNLFHLFIPIAWLYVKITDNYKEDITLCEKQ